MDKKDKRDQITALILTHVARAGLADVQRFSHLSRGVGIGRSLLYFYYKSTEELIEALCDHFDQELRAFYERTQEKQLDFKQYVLSLIEIKDLVFFSSECQKEVLRIPSLIAPLTLISETVDHYSFERFKVYYQLMGCAPEQVEFLYGCFRSKWWESLGAYDDWSLEALEQFFQSVDGIMSSYAPH